VTSAGAVRRIWTIGYERATLDAVIAALKSARIEVLVDIRSLPLSRKPGFSKTALQGAVMGEGIAYRHMKALGTPPEGREAARKGNRPVLERIYGERLELPEVIAAAAQLRDLAVERRTALLCYCRDAAKCHRSILNRVMLTDFEVVDLLPD
jgi:uncharacterized protein (DUF488 family)